MGTETYKAKLACGNCGDKTTVDIPKGIPVWKYLRPITDYRTPHDERNSEENFCPNCGVKGEMQKEYDPSYCAD